MTIGELKEIIQNLPDDANIFVTDSDCNTYSLDIDEIVEDDLYLTVNKI